MKETIDFPAGTLVVRTAQPLANVAAYLLEPQSNDGLMTWNFFDRYLVPQWGMGYNPYPVYKVIEKIDIKTVLNRSYNKFSGSYTDFNQFRDTQCQTPSNSVVNKI